MDSITQNSRFRQVVVRHFLKNGASKTMELYDVSRATIYRWRRKYDGALKSLEDGSHRPHHHPNEHTAEELKHIKDLRKRNKHDGLVVFWIKLSRTGRGVQFVYQIQKVSYKLEWLIRSITECLIKNVESVIAQDANLRHFEVGVDC